MRQKQTEQSILFEKWNNSTEELEIIIKSIGDKVKQYLNSLLQRVTASEILQDLISRSMKEQAFLIMQSIDNCVYSSEQQGFDKLKSLVPLVLEVKTFVTMISEQQEIMINDVLNSKQDFRLMETKVEQLETRLGSIHSSDIIQSEKNKFLNNELDNLRQQKLKLSQEIKACKDQEVQNQAKIQELKNHIDTLANENQFLSNKINDIENEKD